MWFSQGKHERKEGMEGVSLASLGVSKQRVPDLCFAASCGGSADSSVNLLLVVVVVCCVGLATGQSWCSRTITQHDQEVLLLFWTLSQPACTLR